MTENEEKLLLSSAVDHWGLDSQLTRTQEKLYLLVLEVEKTLQTPRREYTEGLIEQVAEVKILLQQLEVAYGLGRFVEQERKAQLERLAGELGIDI